METLTPSFCARIACTLEVTARKLGDVHRERDFDYAGLADFLLSAASFPSVLDDAATLGVGQTTLQCIQRIRQITTVNTHLGVVLLLAPLAAVPSSMPIRDGIERVLAGLSLRDSVDTYEAIRLAQPGALGKVEDQDVCREPTLPLREIMALAASRDSIARQYVSGFRDVLDLGLTTLEQALLEQECIEEVILTMQLRLLTVIPDSLIARKYGEPEAGEVSQRAGEVLAAGWPAQQRARQLWLDLDASLRAPGRQRNPGTTADLVTASLFIALREGRMPLPLPKPWRAAWIPSGR